ncbi:hypothetical protein DAPPUDRAFT_314947 [Daphnia pulex]|uniref:Uncharacterized protein n=1 Tax=Daphnia pulex TaxID=6669 RepID=E9G868_DAPPU|nr:hypothetical protein DAPPUDRAFT_314947 [Daphnia pulex]|eukprot:EFX84328.1 hypothetical protein DAPPUDRAFT_314947 [Daphnia pulex]
MELQQPTALLLRWDTFPDDKEIVMKYCSSVVKGDIDAYLYHMGDDLVRHLRSVVGVVAVMGKYLVSTHLYSTLGGLQT